MPPSQAQRRLLELAQSFRISAVLITFAELDLARHLAAGPRSTDELAQAVGADTHALARFLRAAAALDLVSETPQGWQLSPLAAETLLPDSSRSLAHFLAAQAAFYRRWGLLTDAVRSGRAPEASRREERATDWVRHFTLMLYEIARTVSDDVAAALVPLIEGIQRPRVLDLGGGHGEYAMALARAHPNLEAVIFDLPPVTEITRELIVRSGLIDRVSPLPGDFFHDPLGEGYNLVLLFGVLNSMNEEEARRLLGLVYQALAPGGWLAIRATPPQPTPEARLQHALLDLQMLLAAEHGHHPTAAELERWLSEVGFTDLQWCTVLDGNVTLLLARR
ncbi:MAG: methyltransferase [Thermomicrobium sp.]